MTCVFLREGEGDLYTQIYTGGKAVCVTREAETGLTQLQVKGLQGVLEASGSQEEQERIFF